MYCFLCRVHDLRSCGMPRQYSVRFYDGDKLVSSVQTAGNETIGAPALSAPAHYTFAGWYWDKDTWQNPFSENDYAQKPVTSDLSVYAKWTQTEFEVTFEENGGSAVQDGWFGVIEKAPATDRGGFILEGWYTDPSLSKKAVFPLTLTENVTLYAKWSAAPALLAAEGFTLSGKTATSETVYTENTRSAATIPPKAAY